MTDLSKRTRTYGCQLVHECSTAIEFLEYLRPYHAHWVSDARQLSTWIYRGQGNSVFGLTPRAHRKESFREFAELCQKMHNLIVVPEIEAGLNSGLQTLDQVEHKKRRLHVKLMSRIELQAVSDFVALADQLGYAVPAPSSIQPIAWTRMWMRFFSLPVDIPSPTAFALAQHHGLPTRLLDFSRRSIIAAFFACQQFDDEVRKGNSPEKIAVWAIDTHCPAIKADLESEDGRLRLITCPRHQVSFLHAQDGVFLCDVDADQRCCALGDWEPYEDIIWEKEQSSKSVCIQTVTLPSSQVGHLQQLLWQEHVSIAHLMPTLDHVTESLKTKWRWGDAGFYGQLG